MSDTAQDTDGPLTDVIDEIRDAASGQDSSVAVGDLIDAVDERGYGPALAVLPLIELTPIGGIPGFPTLLALLLASITIRLMMGYDHFWAPDWLRRREMDQDRVEKSLDWLKPITHRIDATLHKRLKPLAGNAARKAACVVILALLLTVPPLELVPFATSGPMIVISMFGLAMLFRDGLLMLIGFVGAVLAAGGGLWAWLGG